MEKLTLQLKFWVKLWHFVNFKGQTPYFRVRWNPCYIHHLNMIFISIFPQPSYWTKRQKTKFQEHVLCIKLDWKCQMCSDQTLLTCDIAISLRRKTEDRNLKYLFWTKFLREWFFWTQCQQWTCTVSEVSSGRY